ASGIPDSVRVYFLYLSKCFDLPLNAATCSPSPPSVFNGGYIDNVSLGLLLQGAPSVLSLSRFADAFPANATTSPMSPAFDTCSALVCSDANTAPSGKLARLAVPGDSVTVATGVAPGLRLDLVFRILPGVGNYVVVGNRASGIRRAPTSAAAAAANANSSNFWESYMGNNGSYGTVYAGGSHAMPGGRWDPNGWCSARMDTMERNLFPCENVDANLSSLTPAAWMSTYHEEDPRYTTLGIAKNRCFVVDASLGAGTSCKSKT